MVRFKTKALITQYIPIKTIAENSDLVLFDKVGDLYELYSACDIAIVGGSIIFTKGHNFIEPIHANTVSITGENLSNFKELKENILF